MRQLSPDKIDLFGSVGAKLATMIPAAILGLFATRTIMVEYGAEGFAVYTLILSIPLLLPFADLGIGGAITEVVSRRAILGNSVVYHRINRAAVSLAIIGFAIVTISFILSYFNLWNKALGLSSNDAGLAATIAASTFGAGIPLVLGYRVLLGLQLNRLVVLLQGIAGIAGSALVIPAAMLLAPLWLIAVIPSGLALVGAAAAATIARNRLRVAAQKEDDGGQPQSNLPSISRLAIPMAVIAIATPISYQSDRLILANFSSPVEVATYAAAFQLYGPLNAVLVSAGQALWPRLTHLRVSMAGNIQRLVGTYSLQFGLVALSAGTVLVVFGGLVTDWSTGGKAGSPISLSICFGLLLVVNACQYPFGMFMMDRRSLALQAGMIALMAVAKIPLGVVLTGVLGAVGPVLATVISFLTIVLLPSFLWCRYRWKVGNRGE